MPSASRAASTRARTPPGTSTGWTAVALLPWTRARGEGAGGHRAAAEAGRPLALQRLPHRAPRRARGIPRRRRSTWPGRPPGIGASTSRWLSGSWSSTGRRAVRRPGRPRRRRAVLLRMTMEVAGLLRMTLALALLPTSACRRARRPGEIATPSPAPFANCHEESREVMGCTGTVRACGPDASALPAVVGRSARRAGPRRPADEPLPAATAPSRASTARRRTGPAAVEPELLAFLAECLRWSRESDGAFDVTVGPLMKAWGFFRGEGRVPGEDELAQVRAVVGYRHVRLDTAAGTVRFDRPGVELDLGGIGKGYAVDRVVSLLRRGASPRPWSTSVAAASTAWARRRRGRPGRSGSRTPTDPARVALTVPLRDRALSVSGGTQRFFEQDGVTYAHVMDPRTGRPVQGAPERRGPDGPRHRRGRPRQRLLRAGPRGGARRARAATLDGSPASSSRGRAGTGRSCAWGTTRLIDAA